MYKVIGWSCRVDKVERLATAVEHLEREVEDSGRWKRG